MKSSKCPDSIESRRRLLRKSRLIYSSDDEPGLQRIRVGKGFRYASVRGRTITSAKTIQRIDSLVIPPAWQDVWICRQARGHLQATGRDARGRKQYIYHPQWRSSRDETKFGRLVSFAKSLGKLRSRVRRDLRQRGLPSTKVMATIVRLLEDTHIRIGNEGYVRENGSFGLTTLRDRHARVRGASICFQFSGKSGIHHDIDLNDRRLAAIVKHCQELPGQELFQFIDDDGNRCKATSDDVNAYIRAVMAEDFTAKDFRTWAGTVLACTALTKMGEADSLTAAKRNVVAAIAHVAESLGNTKSICRKCYIHPAVIDAYLDGSLARLSTHRHRKPSKAVSGLSRNETFVYKLLLTMRTET